MKNDDDFLCPLCKAGPMIADYCPSCDRIEYGSGQAADIIDEQKAELEALRKERDEAIADKEGWHKDFIEQADQLTRYRAVMEMMVETLEFHEDYDGCRHCMDALKVMREVLNDAAMERGE